MFSGSVSSFIIGFMNILNRARHAPTTKEDKTESTFTPEINSEVIQTATESINQRKIIRINYLVS